MILEKPWGVIREYILNQVCTVKLIMIAPGRTTSLHHHNLRDDIWVILDDGLEVWTDDKLHHPKAGDEFVIRSGTPHRITAREKPGRVLEIDFGFTTEEDTVKDEDGDE